MERYLPSLIAALTLLGCFSPSPESKTFIPGEGTLGGSSAGTSAGLVRTTGGASTNAGSGGMSTGSACVPTLTGPTTYPIGNSPAWVVTADFNGDGKLDLAVANEDGWLGVMLGYGDGTFTAEATYPAGRTPVTVVAADFNGDGKLDLAVVNSGDGTVSVFLGRGDGTFAEQAVYAAGAWAESMAAGDLNGDGRSDLVVLTGRGNSDGGAVVLLSESEGGFSPPTYYPVGITIEAVALGDFNGDGLLDLVVTTMGSYAPPFVDAPMGVNLLLNQGNGTFGSPISYPTNLAPRSVAVGDLNGDGKPDLALANSLLTMTSMSVLINQNGGQSGGQGGTAFAPEVSYLAPNPSAIALADFNGDGRLDIALVNSGQNVSIYQNLGNGTFATPANFNYDGNNFTDPTSIAVGDFNGDGRPDVAVTDGWFGTLTVFLNSCSAPTP